MLHKDLQREVNVHLKWLILAIIPGLLAGGISIIIAWNLSILIHDFFLADRSVISAKPVFYLLALMVGLRAILQWGSDHSATQLSYLVKRHLRSRLFRQAHRITSDPETTTGSILTLIGQGIDALDAYLSHYLPQLFLSGLIPLIILLTVFPLDLLTAIVLMVTAPLIPLFMVLIGNLAKQETKKQWQILSRMGGFFLDVIRGLETIKYLGKSREQVEKVKTSSQHFTVSTLKVLKIAFLSAFSLELLATISTAIIAVEIGLRLLYGHIDYQKALFILLLAPDFYQPLRALGARFHAGMEGIEAANTIFKYDFTEPAVSDTRHVPVVFDSIQFSHVHFTYPGRDREAVQDLTFTLSRGEPLGLIGPSGAGKSTIVKLILSDIIPQSGYVSLGHTSLNQIETVSWQQHISWLPQHPTIFHGSLADNLRIAAPGASEFDMLQALEKSHLSDFLTDLDDGLNTQIGDMGIRLSFGQRQRLSLARLFLRSTPVILLDEPGAHLDSSTHQLILQSVADYAKDRLVLIITHSREALSIVQKIIHLENGRLLYEGPVSDAYLSQQSLFESPSFREGSLSV